MAQLSGFTQRGPHPCLVLTQFGSQIAHPPGFVAEQRFNTGPQDLLFGAERQTVLRQVQPPARIAK
ncbi:hypothetical protein D3C78_1570830 [compost metagenome]